MVHYGVLHLNSVFIHVMCNTLKSTNHVCFLEHCFALWQFQARLKLPVPCTLKVPLQLGVVCELNTAHSTAVTLPC